MNARFDGHAYQLEAGDVAWAGVGYPLVLEHPARHAPVAGDIGAGTPPRYSYRFVRDWDYLREALDRDGERNG